MRLNKWISHNTHFSRREADLLISQSRVKLNNRVATLGDNVGINHKVFIDGKAIKLRNNNDYTVIVYNKPKNELVTKKDDRGRRVIYDALSWKFKHFIPIGRLDFQSRGLLLLTDNVNIATLLMNSSLLRTYNLKISGKLNDSIISSMANGLSLDDATAGGHHCSNITSMDFAPFSYFKIITQNDKWTKIRVGITEGKNRELRRFFAHFGLSVIDLKRVGYGFIDLDSLPEGKSRYFSSKDYDKLREFLRDTRKKVNDVNRDKRK